MGFRIGILRGVNEKYVRIGGKERRLQGQGCSAVERVTGAGTGAGARREGAELR